jgi:hypothetical protein
MTDDQDHKGYANAVTTTVALITILASLHPDWGRIVALSSHTAEVTTVLTGMLSTIAAAVTKPNAKIHGWLLDARAWLASFFRRKPVV